MTFKSKNGIRFFIVLLLLTNLFWLIKSYNEKHFPYHEINNLKRKAIKLVKIKKDGKEAYIENAITAQLAKNVVSAGRTNSIITSVLPLTKTYISLVDKEFPKVGGGLAVAEGKIVVLDRLGRFYLYDEDTVRKLDFVVPNNLERYLIEYEEEEKLGPAAFRSHNVVYDAARTQIYASFTRFEEGVSTRLVVASVTINKSDFSAVGDWTIIYESPVFFNLAHQTKGGGKILLKDNSLFLSMAHDFGEEKDGKWYSAALDSESPFGKILKIDLSNNQWEVYSKGHRNVQGMALFNKQDILATEHGPQGGDEVNLVEKGSNYGWPARTYGTRYGTYDYKLPLEPIEADGNFTEPFLAFVPSIGISPIVQVRDFNPRWEGDVLVGSLKAQTLFRLKQVDGRVIFQEPIWIGDRIRDIVELGNKLILLTDNAQLVVVEVDEWALEKNSKSHNLIATEASVATCVQCHQFAPTTPTSSAPSLSNIFNKKIGSDNYDRYSEALKNYDGVWDEENLKQFIKNPAKLIPGTTMPPQDLTDEEIATIVALFKAQ